MAHFTQLNFKVCNQKFANGSLADIPGSVKI